jgi:hypothetical protein
MELSTPEAVQAPRSDVGADERFSAAQTASTAPAPHEPADAAPAGAVPGPAGPDATGPGAPAPVVAMPVRAVSGLVVLGAGNAEMCSDGFCS